MPNWYLSDDPIRDAERWLDDEMEYCMRLPACRSCREQLRTERSYLIDGELYCACCRGTIDVDPDDVCLVYTEEYMEAC